MLGPWCHWDWLEGEVGHGQAGCTQHPVRQCKHLTPSAAHATYTLEETWKAVSCIVTDGWLQLTAFQTFMSLREHLSIVCLLLHVVHAC